MTDTTMTSLQEFGIKESELTTEIMMYPAEMPGRIALIDADFIAYHVAYLFPDAADVISIEQKADDIADHYRKAVGAERKITCTTIGDNKSYKFFMAIQKPYQWTRKTEKIPTVDVVKHHLQYLDLGNDASLWEADDQISVLAWKALMSGVDAVIVSPDKDLRMIHGKHYNFKTGCIDEHYGFGKLSYTDRKLSGYGDVWFWAQMLMGDRVDGITGLPFIRRANGHLAKVGPKTAYEVLKDITNNRHAMETVSALYAELDGMYFDYRDDTEVFWKEVFMSEASMLWMRRSFNQWDVVLWLGGKYDQDETNGCYCCTKSDAEKTVGDLSTVFATHS